MKLHVQRWGSGPRTAVLVHGATDDHTTWHRVAPHLAAQGFQVLAPDLRGHGQSDRADSYLLADFAADLVESLPTGADLLLGHSLGALAVALATEQLQPTSIVYVDPPWRTDPHSGAATPGPPWSEEDSDVDLRSTMRTDPTLAAWIPEPMLRDLPTAIPTAVTVPTLVLEPETAPMVDRAVRERLQQAGMAFTSLPGVRHVIHRDDLPAFLNALDDWVRTSAPLLSDADRPDR